MSDEELLADLLLEWEERAEQGENVSADELCQDCLQLAPFLAERIRALQSLAWIKNSVVSEKDGQASGVSDRGHSDILTLHQS